MVTSAVRAASAADGPAISRSGPEGVNWVKPDAGDVALDDTLQPLFKTRRPAKGEGGNNSLGAIAQFFSDAEFRERQAYSTKLYEPAGEIYQEAGRSLSSPTPESTQAGPPKMSGPPAARKSTAGLHHPVTLTRPLQQLQR